MLLYDFFCCQRYFAFSRHATLLTPLHLLIRDYAITLCRMLRFRYACLRHIVDAVIFRAGLPDAAIYYVIDAYDA